MLMLEQFLVAQVFALFLIFCRIGGCIMVLPGFGENYVPPSVRISLTFMISLILLPLIGKSMPPVPASAISFVLLVASEILIGLFIGSICKILIAVTHVTGMFFSFQSGMSSAVVYDVTQSAQGSLLGNFMGLMALVLIFSTGLHHIMLRAATDSYVVFTPGHWPPLHDLMETIARTVSDVFLISLQLSTPLLVIGTLLFLGAGVLARLMPTIQIFFLITAPQLMVCLFMLSTTISAIMLWYMEFYREKLLTIFTYVK